MKKITLILSCSLLFASQSFAVSNFYYNCPHKDVNKTRVIEMVFHSELSTAPCEVVYHKPDKEPKVLWEAWNEEGYCEAKGAQFAEKLKGWGWICERVDGWYISQEEQEVVEQGEKISFQQALERRKVELEIRGMQLEKQGLIKEARKKAPEADSSPSATTAENEIPEKQKTDWEKKMEELQKKKARVFGKSPAASTTSE